MMDFEIMNGIYNYISAKKEKKEEILYLVETDRQNFVVNRKIVAMMLVCPLSPNELMNANFANVNKEEQKDNKSTLYLSLNKSGNDYYSTMDVEQRSNAFFIALSQLNNEEKSRRYKKERKIITTFCLKNGIRNIDKTVISSSKQVLESPQKA